MEKCDLRIGRCDGRSVGRQYWLRYHDELHRDGRCGEPRLTLGGREQGAGTRNLVSERTIAAAVAALEVREIDRVVVAGHTHSEVIFEILGCKDKLTPKQLSLRESYLEGLTAYRERRWDDALRALDTSLAAMPGDGPSLALSKRIEGLKANPPHQDSDGSWNIKNCRRRCSVCDHVPEQDISLLGCRPSYLRRICSRSKIPVCTDNLNAGVAVVKSAQDGA
jgi:hypothetical protein